MLRWRLLLGFTFVAALVGLCWLDAHAATPGAWLLPLVLVVGVAGAQELSQMMSARLPRPSGVVAYGGNAAILVANWLPHLWPERNFDPWTGPIAALAAALMLALALEALRFAAPGDHTERLAATSFSLLYIGVLLSFAAQLRFAGPNGAWGMAALASLLIVVKMSDIGAYTVGRLIGRHKLAPLLSPGKTIEGSVGGLAFSSLGAWFSLGVLMPHLAGTTAPQVAVWQWLGFGITVGIAGMLGDLAESLLKRDLGRKDSSDWMPGFGGVLDLLDSILVAAPVAYLWWMYGL